MDPNVLNIFLGVISSGLTSLIAQLSRTGGRILIGEGFLSENDSVEGSSLQQLLKEAIDEIVKSEPLKGWEANEEIVCLFLLSPEAEEFVRQIYSTQLLENKKEPQKSNREKQKSLMPLRKLFSNSLSLFFDYYPDHAKPEEKKFIKLTNDLFETLIKACNLALERAIYGGVLVASEARSAFRHHILLDEIAAIHRKLDYLADQQGIDIQAILTFERKYRQQFINRHKDITPPYLDTVRKFPIRRMYVNPYFNTSSQNKLEIKTFKMEKFLSGIYRTVLLGHPGGGKSTLSLKLCYELASRPTERLFAGRKEVTPILVILREYGAEKKLRNCSILQFIEAKVNANYQIQPPPRALEYLLLSGRTAVIFDGLDELLDTSYRQEISSDVESFCNLYPSVPALVTSRQIGYEQAPLDEEKFDVFHLAPFDEDQIQEYVKRWFFVAYDELSFDKRQQKARSFYEESAIVPDLRSNPLMLALMCNIYRGENYIPRNRPDLYEKCAMMLFERWDKSRGINVLLPFDWHVRPMMEDLAYWIYVDERLRGGVTEEELTIKSTQYLCEWLFEDYNKAKKAAQEFISFCTGRAWVFTDTGTQKNGERLYQFTHATFLEYFTASYLVRIHRTPQALISILKPKIARQEWDVMAQLAFQLQNRKIAGAADELLTALIDDQAIEDDAKHNLLLFAVRCLEFIVPRPKVTRDIVNACIKYALKWGIAHMDAESSLIYSRPGDIFAQMANTSVESAPVVNEHLMKEIVSIVSSASTLEALFLLEIGISFPTFQVQHLFNLCESRINELYPNCFWLCHQLLRLNKISIADVTKWHSLEGIFRQYELLLIGASSGMPSLAQIFMKRLVDSSYNLDNFNWLIDHRSHLREIGFLLISTPIPWIKVPKRDLDFSSNWWLRSKKNPVKEPLLLQLNADELFSGFLLFAIQMNALEIISTNKEAELLNSIWSKIVDRKFLFFQNLHWILIARYENIEPGKIQAEMENLHFTVNHQEFAWKWIRREINLVDSLEY